MADRDQDALTETVVNIRRVAKTAAGGRRFTFNALVVVGDGQGRVGFGMGKASEVPDAVQKGTALARRAMSVVPLAEHTVPQQLVGRFCGAQVMLKPAAPGTGVRASAAVRAVVQAAGVRDILTKSLGSNNPINVVQATIKALHMMRNPADTIALRRMIRGEDLVDPTPTAPIDAVDAASPTASMPAAGAVHPPTAAVPSVSSAPEAAAESSEPAGAVNRVTDGAAIASVPSVSSAPEAAAESSEPEGAVGSVPDGQASASAPSVSSAPAPEAESSESAGAVDSAPDGEATPPAAGESAGEEQTR
ncbi:MAG: 30S ribosomal protein S5 [Chloroflexi bacterium]|nr:30S ribosomal protein S5 [Chloroflexota bacterium]